MSDGNVYPDNAKARRRKGRKPRPAHLPPYEPDAPKEANARLAERALDVKGAAAASFGAKPGANNVLLARLPVREAPEPEE